MVTHGEILQKIEDIERRIKNEIWHELNWHRYLLLLILSAIVAAAIKLFVS